MGSGSEQVKREIEEAFSSTRYPGDEAITWASGDEAERLRKSLAGRHWRDVPREVIRYHHDNLALFTEEGFQFYLPAWLLAALDDFWDVLDFVLSQLVPSSKEDVREFRTDVEERFGRFTPAQRRALRSFLAHVRDERPERCIPQEIERVLDLYWKEEGVRPE